MSQITRKVQGRVKANLGWKPVTQKVSFQKCSLERDHRLRSKKQTLRITWRWSVCSTTLLSTVVERPSRMPSRSKLICLRIKTMSSECPGSVITTIMTTQTTPKLTLWTITIIMIPTTENTITITITRTPSQTTTAKIHLDTKRKRISKPKNPSSPTQNLRKTSLKPWGTSPPTSCFSFK